MPWLGRDYADPRDLRSLVAQSKKFRRWRPWMWGPLRSRWTLHYAASIDNKIWGPDTYTWRGWKPKKEEDCCCERN